MEVNTAGMTTFIPANVLFPKNVTFLWLNYNLTLLNMEIDTAGMTTFIPAECFIPTKCYISA